MNEMTIINKSTFLGKEIDVYGTAENPLFLAKDVAEWIEHSDVSMMVKSIDECEKVTSNVCTLGGSQGCLVLNGRWSLRMTANKFIQKGLLTENERQGVNKIHKFKVITPKGLEYGENEVSPHNQKETQPHWYDDKFGELLGVVGIQ